MKRSCLVVTVMVLTLLIGAWPAGATTWTVSTAADLDNVWRNNIATGDTIVIMPGTYNLQAGIQLGNSGKHDITIRGATGNRDDIILVGGGMNVNGGVKEGILVNGNNITIQDLTLKDFFYNAIHIRAENNADGARINNVKTWNIGERHVKVSRDGAHLDWTSDNVIVENSYFLQTIPRENTNPSGGDYIGGIDAMGIDNWIIRNNVAEGIRGFTGEGNAAIMLWSGVSNVLIEKNRIFNCGKGIGLGNPSYAGGTAGWPNTGGKWQTLNVTVRNNMIRRSTQSGGNNIGMEFCNVKDAKIYNNTVYSDNAGYSRTFSVLDDNGGGITTNLDPKNNVFRGNSWEPVPDHSAANWSSAALAAMGNIVDGTGATVDSSWFWDYANGNMRLTEQALAAIGHGVVLADAPTDFDGEGLYGTLRDMGADEFRLRGDASLDLDVDFADYQTLEVNFGKTTGATWTQGDFDYDKDVDFADYQALEDRFGTALNPANIPEPGTLLLAALGLAGLLRRRRR